MKIRLFATRACALSFVVMTSTVARPVAVSPLTTITPPAEVANTFVRVGFGTAPGVVSELGSGTIIDVHPDAIGPGGWFCVLTADHVLTDDTGALGTFFSVGFGNEGAGGLEFTSTTTTINALGSPTVGTERVDLGLLGVRVGDLSTLPTFTTPSLGAVSDGSTFNLAGYGWQGILDGANRRYEVVETYGTLMAGFNGVDAQVEHSIVSGSITYRYTSIEASTMFGPPAPDPAIQGEAHVLSGDSGGPSWFEDSFGWTLVGVHSTSQTTSGGGSTWVAEGDEFHDVRVASYTAWIEESCAAVVPEPGSVTVAAMAFIVWRLRRRSRSLA